MNTRVAVFLSAAAVGVCAGLFAALNADAGGDGSEPATPGATASAPSASAAPSAPTAPSSAAPGASPGPASAVERLDSCPVRTGTTPGPFYPGPSASKEYDELFAKSAPVPGLATHTPQGIAAWPDWDGKGGTLLVIGSYARGAESHLYGVDPETGRLYGPVALKESHLGGIAVSGPWLITQGRSKIGREPVRRYRLADLRERLTAEPARDVPFLAAAGESQEIYGADFMTSHDGRVWAGRYNNAARDLMYEYKVDADGVLRAVGAGWEIPPNTQGVLVTDNRFVFSRSHLATRASAFLVTERGHRKLDDAKRTCLRGPSMSENLAQIGPWVYLLSEGGSAQYAARALNPVADLHRAQVAELSNLDRE